MQTRKMALVTRAGEGYETRAAGLQNNSGSGAAGSAQKIKNKSIANYRQSFDDLTAQEERHSLHHQFLRMPIQV